MTGAVQENVVTLDITVDDVLTVQVGQSSASLGRGEVAVVSKVSFPRGKG